MKKHFTKMFVIAGVILATFSANAQTSFNHSFGGGLYAGEQGAGWALLYSPRINFLELADEVTVSGGTHLGLGFSGSANSQSGASYALLLDAPLMAELNIGHAANPDASSAFGGFIGVGLGYNKMSAAVSDALGNSVSANVSSAGFVINGGLRGLIKERSVGLRVSYMINAKSGGQNIFGLGLFYTLGMN